MVCRVSGHQVEARMSRSMRTPSGIGTSVNVVSGNFFFTAQPLGVRNGIDMGFSGKIRRIDVEAMTKTLASGDVVLLTSLGYAASGQTYSVPSASLATAVASQLGASKLIWITDGQRLVNPRGELVQSMRLSDARGLVEHYGLNAVNDHLVGTGIEEAPSWMRCSKDPATASLINLCRLSVTGLQAGVLRAHIIAPVSGDLLRELYTCDGAGTLICRDM